MVDPLQGPSIDEAEALALRALWLGQANQFQQRIALAWIIGKACRVTEPVFCPGKTEFYAGMQFAGLAIAGAAGAPLIGDALREKDKR